MVWFKKYSIDLLNKSEFYCKRILLLYYTTSSFIRAFHIDKAAKVQKHTNLHHFTTKHRTYTPKNLNISIKNSKKNHFQNPYPKPQTYRPSTSSPRPTSSTSSTLDIQHTTSTKQRNCNVYGVHVGWLNEISVQSYMRVRGPQLFKINQR